MPNELFLNGIGLKGFKGRSIWKTKCFAPTNHYNDYKAYQITIINIYQYPFGLSLRRNKSNEPVAVWLSIPGPGSKSTMSPKSPVK